jgi:rRNA-processing protein FCF1
MKKLRIYLDTSVIGGCFDSGFSLWSNGLLNDFKLGNFQPILSEIVAAEIEDAPEHIQEKYAEIVDMGAEYLEISEEVLELADVYLKNHAVNLRLGYKALQIFSPREVANYEDKNRI